MTKRSRKPEPGRRLYRLRSGRTLHYPEALVREPEEQVWARPGQVVDFTDRPLWGMTVGQRFKLEEIDESAFDSARADGVEWLEAQAPAHVNRRLKEMREAAPGGAEGEKPKAAKVQAEAAPAVPDEKPAAPRRAADVEAALAEETR